MSNYAVVSKANTPLNIAMSSSDLPATVADTSMNMKTTTTFDTVTSRTLISTIETVTINIPTTVTVSTTVSVIVTTTVTYPTITIAMGSNVTITFEGKIDLEGKVELDGNVDVEIGFDLGDGVTKSLGGIIGELGQLTTSMMAITTGMTNSLATITSTIENLLPGPLKAYIIGFSFLTIVVISMVVYAPLLIGVTKRLIGITNVPERARASLASERAYRLDHFKKWQSLEKGRDVGNYIWQGSLQ